MDPNYFAIKGNWAWAYVSNKTRALQTVIRTQVESQTLGRLQTIQESEPTSLAVTAVGCLCDVLPVVITSTPLRSKIIAVHLAYLATVGFRYIFSQESISHLDLLQLNRLESSKLPCHISFHGIKLSLSFFFSFLNSFLTVLGFHLIFLIFFLITVDNHVSADCMNDYRTHVCVRSSLFF